MTDSHCERQWRRLPDADREDVSCRNEVKNSEAGLLFFMLTSNQSAITRLGGGQGGHEGLSRFRRRRRPGVQNHRQGHSRAQRVHQLFLLSAKEAERTGDPARPRKRQALLGLCLQVRLAPDEWLHTKVNIHQSFSHGNRSYCQPGQHL